MKNLLSFFILSCIAQIAYGQHHLDQTSTWTYYRSQWISQTTTKEFYRTVTIDGDSTIQGRTYFKRYVEGVDVITSPTSSTISPIARQFSDLVRDDVGHFYAYTGGQDLVVMDFTKMLGDSVKSINGFCTDSINQIDSVYLGSQALKKWTITNYTLAPYVEGVGELSNLALANHCSITGYSYGLVCYEKQGNQLIINPAINCGVYNSIIRPKVEGLELSIYPNPTSGVVYLENPMDLNGEIQLFNLTGQLLRKKQLMSQQTRLDLEELPQGSYWLTVISDRKVMTKKIIKL